MEHLRLVGLSLPLTPPPLRCAAGTAVVTVAVTAALLLYDWKAGNGLPTVFDDVRPLVRSAFERAFGPKSPDQDRSQRPAGP